jgi:protein-tyrosine phosphatase
MGYSRAGYNSAAYLVAALSQLEVEELEAVLRRNDLLPRQEPHC